MKDKRYYPDCNFCKKEIDTFKGYTPDIKNNRNFCNNTCIDKYNNKIFNIFIEKIKKFLTNTK